VRVLLSYKRGKNKGGDIVIQAPEKLKSINTQTKLEPVTVTQIIAATSEDIAGLFLKLKEGRDNVVTIVNCSDSDLFVIKHSHDHNNGKFVEKPPPIIPSKTVGLFSSSKSSYSVTGNKNYVLYSMKGLRDIKTEVLVYWHLPLLGEDAYWSDISPDGTYENKPDKEILGMGNHNAKTGMIHCIDPSEGYGLCTYLRKGRIECALMTTEQMWWDKEELTETEELEMV